MSIKLVEYDKAFLDYSWQWINDDEIRELISAPIITKEQQNTWFNNLKDLKNYFIWGIMFNDFPIGVCGIKNVEKFKGEYWGYIGDKNYWGKGFGKDIMLLVEKKAIELRLEYLWLKVNFNNERAIKLYKKMNYIIQGNDGNMQLMEKVL